MMAKSSREIRENDPYKPLTSPSNSKRTQIGLPVLYTNEDPILYPFIKVDKDYFKFPRNQLFRQNSKLAILVADIKRHVTVELSKTPGSIPSTPKDSQQEVSETDIRPPLSPPTKEVKKNKETRIEVNVILKPDPNKTTLSNQTKMKSKTDKASLGRRLLEYSKGVEYLASDVDTVCTYLCSDKLEVSDESVVFRAAHRWIRFRPKKRAQHCERVMQCVRFGLIKPPDLIRCYVRSRSLNLLDYPGFCKQFNAGLLWSSAVNCGLENLVPELQPRRRNFPIHVHPHGKCPPLASCNSSVTNLVQYQPQLPIVNSYVDRKEVTIIRDEENLKVKTDMLMESPTLVLIGGVAAKNASGITGSQIIFYDDDARAWSDMKPFPTPLCLAAACYVESSDSDVRGLYVTGGCYPKAEGGTKRLQALPHVWKYRSDTTLWVRMSDMNEARMQHAAVAIPINPNGAVRMLVIGGTDRGHRLLTNVESYNPVENVWENVNELPRPMRDVAATYYRDSVWVCGGFCDGVVEQGRRLRRNSSLWILDTALSFKWSDQKWVYHKSLRIPRAQASLVARGEQLFIVGGVTYNNSGDEIVAASIDKWTPAAIEWTRVSMLPTPRYGTACFIKQENSLMVVGGMTKRVAIYSDQANSTDVVESLDLQQMAWSTLVPKLPRRVEGFCSAIVPKKIILKV